MAKVKHQVGVVGGINQIFRALHEPDGLAGWWSTKAEGRGEVGHVLDLHFQGLAVLSFRVDVLESDRRVRLTCVSGPGSWQDSDLTFTLKQDTDQVWVGLEHVNDTASDDDFLYFSTKWTVYLLSLRDLIETGKGRPYPHDVKIHRGD